jgi:hypothetical protein
MTAAQLVHLAEQAASAAGYYADIDPSNARRFAEVALVAVRLSAELAWEEHIARIGYDLIEIKAELGPGPKGS